MKRARSRLGFLLVLGMLTALLPVGALSPASAATPGDIVINEIMQNPSAVADSAGEWFELFNPTGADIDINGWTIADNDTDSHLISNGGPLLVPAGGHLVLGNNTDSVTNGGVTVAYSYGGSWFLGNSGDEAVLLDDTLVEIDRVEWDNGATFPDPNGASMALNNPANDNNDGTNWCTAATPYGAGDLGTPGAANDCPPPPAPEMVINEIMQNPSAVADSAGEWFELFNPTGADIDINGWTIADNDTDSHLISNGGPLLVPAGGHLVLGNNTDSVTNGGVTVAYSYGGSWFLGNSGDEAVLLDDTLVEIDRVEWDNGATFPDPNGASMALNNPANDNNDGTNWCTAATPYGAGDLGTPGAANDCPPPPEPSVVINEVDADTPGTDALEFMELFDGGAGNTSLDGLVVVFYNGNGDASYNAIDLDGFSTDASGYFTLGNAGVIPAPSIVFGSNGIQNGADAVALYSGDAASFPDGTAVTTTGLLDAIVYDTNDGDDAGLLALLNAGQPQVNEGGAGDKDNHSNQRCPNGTGGALNTSSYEQWAPTPAAENTCTTPPAVPTFIHDIQGSGFASGMIGAAVTIEGIVVGDFQGDVLFGSQLNGYFVQEEEVDYDADPLTSEGIFVFAPGGAAVAEGDLVRVTGTVSEFVTSSGASSLTQVGFVSAVDIVSAGNSLPATTSITLPVSAIADLEAYEGMAVSFSQSLVISEYFNFDRFNEVVLTTDRAAQPTAVFDPGSVDAANLADLNVRSRITLDDGRTSQNPDIPMHPDGSVYSVANSFRGGDLITDATGVMSDTFGLYRIQPTASANYTAVNDRPATPDDVGGDLTVASFNVLNYFTTVDTGAPICGPAQNLGCRGADDADELERQRTKIIAAVAEMNADVVGLIEIENHHATTIDEPLADLVSGLNDAMGAGTYDYVDTGSIGDDAIKVAFIYKPATVTPDGAFAILDSSVDARFNDDKNRPALAQTFTENATSEAVTVTVNHFKSKGSSCASIGDPDLGDGAGNCNLTRTDAALALVDWLANPANGFDEDVLVIGDLNSYDKEDPIDALIAGGYSDLALELLGEFAYSFVFSGQWGYLDYAMANDSLRSAVTGTTIWHINADEPDILDYDTRFNDPSFYEPNAFRASDHDPVIVGLDLAQPQVDKGTLIGDLVALLPTGDKNTTKRIEAAIAEIEASLTLDWWVDNQTITSKKVFDAERKAVVQLELVVASGVPEAVAAQEAIDILVNADRQLARIAIISATNAGGDPVMLAEAEAAMAEAAAYISAGLYSEAVNAYKTAWDKATKS
ncbi:MAG: ExeM/NucH family extracellular endonuclease [Actinomycetota bacterium]|nr:ExeM/NucH family extracellular endonuclease [Actinomycetota bacterium]